MRKDRILMQTNLFICLVTVVGFLLTAILSYRANYSASIQNVEQVSTLTSEGIYYQLSSLFTKPVNVSLTMANDSLLREFLSKESEHMDDARYIGVLREYLEGYQVKYGYDSVFLVSAATARYYNFHGLDRILAEGDPENVWYYDVILQSDDDYCINVDNDEVAGAGNAITVFVNCKIKDNDGSLLGVVGVGVRIDDLQQTLQEYQDKFDMNACLINDEGTIEISTQFSGYEKVNLFELESGQADNKEQILGWKEEGTAVEFWNLDQSGRKEDYIVARYLPELQWYLVVERNTASLMEGLMRQLVITVCVIVVILSVILILITNVVRRFNRQIVRLTKDMEQERQTIFEKATEKLFENIYELDITHNCPANRTTEEYFQRLGVPPGACYDKALRIIAQKQIKEEYREGYLSAFLPENVLRAYERGVENLRYEFMITKDGAQYYWMRITAHIVRWESDQSIHMLVYRQNIDAEKRQEEKMQLLAQTDEMTGLLTKTATQRRVEQTLSAAPDKAYAFLIFDIDQFKQANDLNGHAFGDSVICSFSKILRDYFRREDIIGRIGGDEFAAFLQAEDQRLVYKKAQTLCKALDFTHSWKGMSWHVSASVGVAFAPKHGTDFVTLYQHADAALYQTKERGGRGVSLYTGKYHKEDVRQC